MKGHKLSDKIIKACDIRGIVDKDLEENDAYHIGLSFGTFLRENDETYCVVGRDGRLSSPVMAEQLIRGLLESGVDVCDIGLVPVGCLYFSLSHLERSAAVMVTASHNPAEYNGFKFISGGRSFYGRQLHRIQKICRKGEFLEGAGSLETLDIRESYLDYLHSFLKDREGEGLKIVWDPGNGAVASVISSFTETLPGTHILICDEVDGRFPHHHPNPSDMKNTMMLQERVIAEKADLGIAFDGDGDRLGVVDSEGFLFNGDQTLVLLAEQLLETHPGAVIMSEVNASRFFSDEIRRMGGEALIWKAGHAHQKQKMKELDISLAGETSGHFFFKENGNFDDALFSALKILQQLSSRPSALREMKGRIPEFHDSGVLRIVLGDLDPDAVLRRVEDHLREKGLEFSDVDGVRRVTEHGFWILRKSQTEPHLTFRCEDLTGEGYAAALKLIRKLLTEAGLDFKAP